MSSPNSPYAGLPPRAYWRTGVADHQAGALPDLYRKKFPIDRSMRIATAGSCFAQHIARHLRARQFDVIDLEAAPPGLSPQAAASFGYGLFSARYGNVYTARHLRQLFEEAAGVFKPDDTVWEKDGRYFDALRPSVEPRGMSSAEAVRDHRAFHLARVKELLRVADVFVFTLGLIEAWIHDPSGTVYPTAPGTIAGRYDPAIHKFANFTFHDVYGDLSAFFAHAKRVKPDIRFLLTVSPVPLTATASGDHVLSATTYSKSVLRAVAGQLCRTSADVDYFPSYEIITGAQARGAYYGDDLRSIRAAGVDAAMNGFFAEHDDGREPAAEQAPARQVQPVAADEAAEDAAVCEDVLLEAFA